MADSVFTEAQMRNAKAWSSFNMPARLRPIHEAVEAGIITSKVVYPDMTEITVDSDRGCVLIAFDVLNGGVGPSGFDAKLMGALVEAAAGVVVVTAFDAADPYSAAVDTALKSGGIVIVAETSEGAAQAWLDLAKRPKGDAHWLLWSSRPEGSA